MEVFFIQKGERGLVIDGGGKLLFPDRSWKGAREGFATDVKITKDKDTYAFVSGRMLDIADIGIYDIDICDDCASYWQGEVNGSKYILEYSANLRANNYRIFVRVQNEDGYSTERVSLPNKGYKTKNYLLEHAKPVDVDELLFSHAKELSFESDKQYANEMFKFLRRLYKDSIVTGREPLELEIRVYESSLLLVKFSDKYYHYDKHQIYSYVGELGKGEFKRVRIYCDTDQIWEKSGTLDLEELEGMAYDYGVSLNSSMLDRAFDSRLTCHVFECNGNGVVVYAFNLDGYDLDWLETEDAAPYVGLVDESLDRLSYLSKRLAKIGVGIDNLGKMNVKSWLFPFKPLR